MAKEIILPSAGQLQLPFSFEKTDARNSDNVINFQSATETLVKNKESTAKELIIKEIINYSDKLKW